MEALFNRPRIVIAGLGNDLLMDDGVGVHAIREIRKSPPPGAEPIEVGCSVFDVVQLLASADRVIAIEALRAGGEPGTLYCYDHERAAREGIRLWMHEFGMAALLRGMPPEMRPEVTVLGIEPQTIDYGIGLSEPVQASLPRIAEAVDEIVAGWLAAC